MNIKRKFDIKGIGIALPRNKVSSNELEIKVKLAEGWISKRLGVENRYQVQEETNTTLGVTALKNALADASLRIDDIDLLIGASATFDHVLPNRSSLIKADFPQANLLTFPCLDINTVCTSFISAMDYASHLLESGTHKTIAIVSSEIASKGLNPDDVKTYCLFGDAAAAVVLQATTENKGAIHFLQQTYSESVKQTIIEGGGNKFHPRDHSYDPVMHSFRMEGKSLLRSANKNIPTFFEKFFQNKNLSWDYIDCVIPHQASKNGMKILYNLSGIKQEKIVDILSY